MTDFVKMLSDALTYSKHHMIQASMMQSFMSTIVCRMDWSQEESDTVMDIGCGPGDSSRWILLPAFPNVKKLVGIDVLPDMIQYAKENNAHEKIEYQVADIGDSSISKKFPGTMSKALSTFCFHWLEDQKSAFINLHHILKPGGEAALILVLSGKNFDSFQEIVNNPRWHGYLKEIDNYIPESHFKNRRSLYYKNMLEDVGFNVSICQVEDRCYIYPDDKTCAEECYAICSLSKGIPPELKEEFKEEILRGVLKYNGRNADGKPQFYYSTLSLLIRKPKL